MAKREWLSRCCHTCARVGRVVPCKWIEQVECGARQAKSYWAGVATARYSNVTGSTPLPVTDVAIGAEAYAGEYAFMSFNTLFKR